MTKYIAAYLLSLSLVVVITMLFSSCSLHSVYGERQNSVRSDLCAIMIEPIQSIEGAELYYHLSSLMPSCNVKYRLIITLSSTSVPTIVKKNSDVLRETVSQLVEYKLLNLQNSKLLTFGKFQHTSSYNEDISAYGTYTENEAAIETLARHSAEEIRNRLILFFEQLQL